MPLSFQTNTMPIRTLLSGEHVFRMPPFQRPYSWEDETAAQLFDDIHTAYSRPSSGWRTQSELRDYFLGPLIIAQPDNRSTMLDVVDGQQRLATLCIILAVLRDLSDNDRFKESLQRYLTLSPTPHATARVRLREVDQSNFQAWVIEPGGTNRLPRNGGDLDSDSRILEAIRRIKSEIGKTKQDYITGISDFLLNHSYVILVTADALDDAYILFRSVNSRGQPLTDMDIARAELIGPHVQDILEASKLATLWDDLEDEIGSDEVEKYLQTIIKLVLRTDEADLKFLLREVMLDSAKVREFHDAVVEFLNHYSKLAEAELDFGDSSLAINDAIKCLKAYDAPLDQWRRPALVWLALQPNGRDTALFLQALDGLCLGLLILGHSKSKVAKRFDQIADAILGGSALRSAASPLYLSNSEKADIREILNNPISSRKRFLRPLLLRLNVELRGVGNPVHFPTPLTVEHILPRTPNDEWLALFPDTRERNRLCELIGNYALLTKSLNSSQKNYEYQRKLEKMFSINNNFQGFHITTNLRSFPSWTRRALLSRQEQLVKLAGRILFP